MTYDDRVGRLSVRRCEPVLQIGAAGDLVVPFLLFDPEADSLANVEVEDASLAVVPYPDLVFHVTVDG